MSTSLSRSTFTPSSAVEAALVTAAVRNVSRLVSPVVISSVATPSTPLANAEVIAACPASLTVVPTTVSTALPTRFSARLPVAPLIAPVTSEVAPAFNAVSTSPVCANVTAAFVAGIIQGAYAAAAPPVTTVAATIAIVCRLSSLRRSISPTASSTAPIRSISSKSTGSLDKLISSGPPLSSKGFKSMCHHAIYKLAPLFGICTIKTKSLFSLAREPRILPLNPSGSSLRSTAFAIGKYVLFSRPVYQ